MTSDNTQEEYRYFFTFCNHTFDYTRHALSCARAGIYGCTDLPCDLSVDLAHKKMWSNACHRSLLGSMLWNQHYMYLVSECFGSNQTLLVTRRWCSVRCPLWSQNAWVQILACYYMSSPQGLMHSKCSVSVAITIIILYMFIITPVIVNYHIVSSEYYNYQQLCGLAESVKWA